MEKLPLCVSVERWQQAQEWEGAYWRAQHPDRSHVLTTPLKKLTAKVFDKLGQEADLPSAGDDWKHWGAEQFDQYRILRCMCNNGVEVGGCP